MKLGDLSQSLSAVILSKFSTFRSFENIKVKAHSEYHNESTWSKRAVHWTCSNVFQESRQIWKTARRASMIKYIFHMQYFCKNESIPFVISCNLPEITGDTFNHIVYHKLNQLKTCLKNYHIKSSYIKSWDNLILKSILFDSSIK